MARLDEFRIIAIRAYAPGIVPGSAAGIAWGQYLPEAGQPLSFGRSVIIMHMRSFD